MAFSRRNFLLTEDLDPFLQDPNINPKAPRPDPYDHVTEDTLLSANDLQTVYENPPSSNNFLYTLIPNMARDYMQSGRFNGHIANLNIAAPYRCMLRIGCGVWRNCNESELRNRMNQLMHYTIRYLRSRHDQFPEPQPRLIPLSNEDINMGVFNKFDVLLDHDEIEESLLLWQDVHDEGGALAHEGNRRFVGIIQQHASSYYAPPPLGIDVEVYKLHIVGVVKLYVRDGNNNFRFLVRNNESPRITFERKLRDPGPEDEQEMDIEEIEEEFEDDELPRMRVWSKATEHEINTVIAYYLDRAFRALYDPETNDDDIYGDNQPLSVQPNDVIFQRLPRRTVLANTVDHRGNELFREVISEYADEFQDPEDPDPQEIQARRDGIVATVHDLMLRRVAGNPVRYLVQSNNGANGYEMLCRTQRVELIIDRLRTTQVARLGEVHYIQDELEFARVPRRRMEDPSEFPQNPVGNAAIRNAAIQAGRDRRLAGEAAIAEMPPAEAGRAHGRLEDVAGREETPKDTRRRKAEQEAQPRQAALKRATQDPPAGSGA